jgi:hypothetical protein
LINGGGFKELEQFQNFLSDYKIIVYDVLRPDRVLFNGNSIRTINCTFYMMLATTMSLQISRLLCPRSTYVSV